MNDSLKIFEAYKVLRESDHIDWSEYQDTGEPIISHGDTDIVKITFKDVAICIETAIKNRNSVMLYGDPGIGKSTIVVDCAKDQASQQGRKFVNWQHSTPQIRKVLMQDPGKYYVYIDIRAAQLEPSDLLGIPKIQSDEPYLEFSPQQWAHYMTLPGSGGMLFLDELNQAHRQVQNALFQPVLDRGIGGDIKFTDDWAIIAAGNLGGAFNPPITPALTSRLLIYFIIPDAESWCAYARQNNIESSIIAFVESDPKSNFYALPLERSSDQFPTPRSLFRLSDQMKILVNKYKKAKETGAPIASSIYNVIGNIAAGSCGVRWAHKFLTFIRYQRTFKWAEIAKEPQKHLGKGIEFDKFNAAVYWICTEADKFLSDDKKTPQQNIVFMNELVGMFSALSNEYRAILANNIHKLNKKCFLKLMDLVIRNKASNPAFVKFLEEFKSVSNMVKQAKGEEV